VIRRYFDPKTLNHYYYNPVYGTVSWKKPFCVRRQDLFPFYDRLTAVARIQGIYRMWKARVKVIALLKDQYRKIFDRRRRKFYYANHSKSKVLPRQSWRKPRYTGKRGFPRDIAAVFTSDVAAVRIQRMWRNVLVKRFLWALVRSSHDQVWDPVQGKHTYFQREREVMFDDKPALLGSQPWDPHFVPDWTVDRVCIFFRRMGLKQYLRRLRDYEVNTHI